MFADLSYYLSWKWDNRVLQCDHFLKYVTTRAHCQASMLYNPLRRRRCGESSGKLNISETVKNS